VLVHGDAGVVVVKGPVPAAEADVAGRLAAVLEDAGVPTARCRALVEASDGPWLVLEHLPEPLPRDRWGADPAVLDVLRRLHAIPPGLVRDIPERYLPRWDAAMTERAGDVLEADPALTDRLGELQDRAAPLFEPSVVVSGDANPLNWRLGTRGEPALIDWERITLAGPAVDLGILLPGLPSRTAAEQMAAAYGNVPADALLLVKAWSIVELAATSEPGSEAGELVRGIRDEVRAWLLGTFEDR
jgi:aminoglycoside phosphotransferase (APT) family kinase protein